MDIIIIDGLSFALPLFIMAIGGIYCDTMHFPTWMPAYLAALLEQPTAFSS